MEQKITSICLLERSGEICLPMKLRGFGAGRYNGYGGKKTLEETIEESVIRELAEEAEIVVGRMELRGILDFSIDEPPVKIFNYVFAIREWEGEPVRTDEMEPHWFGIHQLPEDKMWPADRIWLPIYLRGELFHIVFHYRDHDTLAETPAITLLATPSALRGYRPVVG